VSVTLIELRRKVRSRLGTPLSDQFMGDDVIDDSINLAIDAIESEYRWPWQERVTSLTISAGTSTAAALPDDWRATKAVFLNDWELRQVSPTDIYAWPTTDNGQPQVWTLVNDEIIVRPQADVDYSMTHLYYRKPSALTRDADVLDMPDMYAGAVIAKASEWLSVREDDRASATQHLADYGMWIARMRRDTRRSTTPVRVRVREGSWI
jgi:hypothetical protein